MLRLHTAMQAVARVLKASQRWVSNTSTKSCYYHNGISRINSNKQEEDGAMNIEHFTEKAREAISDAAQLARQYNHNQVEVEHLLSALLAQEGGVVPQVIAKVGGNLFEAERIINTELERMPHVYG